MTGSTVTSRDAILAETRIHVFAALSGSRPNEPGWPALGVARRFRYRSFIPCAAGPPFYHAALRSLEVVPRHPHAGLRHSHIRTAARCTRRGEAKRGAGTRGSWVMRTYQRLINDNFAKRYQRTPQLQNITRQPCHSSGIFCNFLKNGPLGMSSYLSLFFCSYPAGSSRICGGVVCR